MFAPTNDAFKKLPEGTIAKLLANPADLKKILWCHVVNGAITMPNLKDGNLTALDGTTLKVVTGDDKGDDFSTFSFIFDISNTHSLLATSCHRERCKDFFVGQP